MTPSDEDIANAVIKWRKGFRRRYNIPIEADGGPYANTDEHDVSTWLKMTSWAPREKEEFTKLKNRVVKIIRKRKAAKGAATREKNHNKARQRAFAF